MVNKNIMISRAHMHNQPGAGAWQTKRRRKTDGVRNKI